MCEECQKKKAVDGEIFCFSYIHRRPSDLRIKLGDAISIRKRRKSENSVKGKTENGPRIE